MADINSLSIKVKIDAREINEGLQSLSGNINVLRIETEKINDTFEDGIDTIKSSLDELKTGIVNVCEKITLAVETCETGIVSALNSILTVVQEIKNVAEGDVMAEALSMGSDATGIVANLKSIFGQSNTSKSAGKEKANNNSGGPEGDWDIFEDLATGLPSSEKKGQLLLPGPTTPPALPGPVASEDSGKSGGDDSAVSGLVSGMFAGGGDFSSMLPDGEMLQSLGELTAKLKESAAAWLSQTGAKIADKAVDLQIMALYALDYVKAFGAMIAQIAASTAAWIANTAVKVANTAAQWAQIAATTAWNALCAVATTLTTAFGAAMAFLTSPIGLVVVAVAALIAIVVLLVKNWDTVKAAALSVWETIKSAFGSAWKWFKETVLDPLVGGFKGMINGIIGFLNGLIAGIVKGINGVIGLLNKLNFDIPDWVPLIGGQTFGFNIAPLTAPKIPLLAQGAVLPANKPFLAVVGDQKHGTNIEAPLATIQQALADVLAQQGNDIHIRFTGDLAQLGRVLKPVIDRENRRVGGSLAKGAV